MAVVVADSWSAWLPLSLLFCSPWLAAIAWIFARTPGRGSDEVIPSAAELWRRRL